MRISVIIPNYNGLDLIKKNLANTYNIFKEDEIIVSDDASTDESVAFIESKFPKIRIIRSNKNSGFSSNVNRGVDASESELFLLLNTDVIPEEGFLKYIYKHFEDNKVFAVGCLQKNDINHDIFSGRGVGYFQRGFLHHQKGKLEGKATLWASGGAAVFKKTIWRKLGGLNDIYNPFYWEDIDICYRAWKCGYKVLFEKRSIVIHIQDQSSIRTEYKNDFIKQISYRNQIYFVWLNISDIQYLLQHFLFLTIQLVKSILLNDRIFLKAFLSSMKNLNKCLHLRSQNLKHFKLKDCEVLRYFRS